MDYFKPGKGAIGGRPSNTVTQVCLRPLPVTSIKAFSFAESPFPPPSDDTNTTSSTGQLSNHKVLLNH